jgi:hypothetical protein
MGGGGVTCKERAVSYFKIMSQHQPTATEGITKRLIQDLMITSHCYANVICLYARGRLALQETQNANRIKPF